VIRYPTETPREQKPKNGTINAASRGRTPCDVTRPVGFLVGGADRSPRASDTPGAGAKAGRFSSQPNPVPSATLQSLGNYLRCRLFWKAKSL
jgi:hypothetical protein